MTRSAAFRVVEDFEAALAEYTGAPHVVTVDSCTNAILFRSASRTYISRLPQVWSVGGISTRTSRP